MTEAIIMQRLDQEVDRVRDHSAQHVNRRIVREMNATIRRRARALLAVRVTRALGLSQNAKTQTAS